MKNEISVALKNFRALHVFQYEADTLVLKPSSSSTLSVADDGC